jgi:hypothetical protein
VEGRGLGTSGLGWIWFEFGCSTNARNLLTRLDTVSASERTLLHGISLEVFTIIIIIIIITVNNFSFGLRSDV